MADAAVWMTGTGLDKQLNFRLPTGGKGDKGDKGDPGQNGANVLPTDTAIANAINGTDTATKAALNSTYATKTDLASAGSIYKVIGELTGDAVPAINSAINEVAAGGGGTVALSPGHVYDANGTVQLKTNVTFDLNGATLKAVNNAAFADINLGTDAITGTAYNPVSIKPVISVIGAVGARLRNVTVRGGKIDGNGVNQPDLGSYANVAVHEADYTIVDVESVDARPGITINEPVGGANTGRRAFCLFVGHALKTTVRGFYKNAGYDSIGLREGAVETTLDNVAAYQAAKGAIQIATGALRTKIIGGIYDNTEGGTSASHAIFCHSAVWLDIIGATTRANTGNCLTIFGDTTWGPSKEINIGNCAMEQSGDFPMVNFPTQYSEKISIHDITFRKTGAAALALMTGASKQIYFRRWSGTSASTSVAFNLTSVTDFEITDMDIDVASTANNLFGFTSCQRGKVSGKYKQVSGPSAVLTTCADITFDRAKLTASDSVWALNGNTNIDVIDCDLTGITNPNKLRIYGAESGRIRGNKGAVTELNGIATLLAANTSVTVTHGLWAGTGTTATPRTDRLWAARDFQVSFAGNPGTASKVWVSSVTPTQVTFTTDAAPGADATLAWSARMDRTV